VQVHTLAGRAPARCPHTTCRARLELQLATADASAAAGIKAAIRLSQREEQLLAADLQLLTSFADTDMVPGPDGDMLEAS